MLGTPPPLLSPLTQEDLGQLQIHLPALKIVSFRGPGHSGGVVSSLSPLTRQLDTQVNWIALTGVPSNEETHVPGFMFHRPEVTSEFVESQARSVSEYLWPLLHGMPEKAHFDPEAWKSFRQLSQTIANASFRVATRSFPTLVWLHDFEMALVPPQLPRDAGVVLCHFWHAPWPSAEIMTQSPVGKEIVESVLYNRVLGFHTHEYAKNFLETVAALLPEARVDKDELTVELNGVTTKVVFMPLGIDVHYWQRLARASRVEAESIPVRYRLAQQVLLGSDRLDYTKGILEKLDGIDAFLQENRNWARRFHYVQLAQPSENKTQALNDYRTQVVERVKRMNDKYRDGGWEPIIYLEGNLQHTQLAAWYQAADILLVTPVRDGLNLIAKEYVASRLDEQGVVIVSEQAGAAAELVSGALHVDALDKNDIAANIARALQMPVEDKRRRMTSMRHVVAWNRLHDWACGFLRTAISTAL